MEQQNQVNEYDIRAVSSAAINRLEALFHGSDSKEEELESIVKQFEERDSKEVASLSSLDRSSQDVLCLMKKIVSSLGNNMDELNESAHNMNREAQRVHSQILNSSADEQLVLEEKQRRRATKLDVIKQNVEDEKIRIEQFYEDKLNIFEEDYL